MNYVILKGGIIKAYDFSDNFINENEKVFEELNNVFNEIYQNNCCVYGASEQQKNNASLKNKICDILEKLYNLNIRIENGFTDEIYNNFDDIRDYILNYGK